MKLKSRERGKFFCEFVRMAFPGPAYAADCAEKRFWRADLKLFAEKTVF